MQHLARRFGFSERIQIMDKRILKRYSTNALKESQKNTFKKGKTLLGNKMVVKLNRLKSSLKQYAKKGKHDRRISKGEPARIEKMVHELIAEKNSSYINERLK